MKRHANEFMRANCGRLAGDGIIEDNYGDESYAETGYRKKSSFSVPLHTPEELEQLMNPPVIIIQAAKKKG